MLPDDSLVPFSKIPREQLMAQYQMLQAYVGWTEDDVRRMKSLRGVAERLLPELVDDSFATIQNHPDALAVITGGAEQIISVRRSLKQWLRDLFSGCYDFNHVSRNWQIGIRLAQVGLPPVFIHAAFARLRQGLMIGLQEIWPGEPSDLTDCFPALNRLLDLSLAIVDGAYQAEILARQ